MAEARGSTVRPPRVLLVAPHNSYRIAAYHEAAGRLGIEVLVASEGHHSLVAAAAEGVHVDLEDPAAAVQRLLAEAARRPFAGVAATDDATVELASRVAQVLGLPHNPPAAARTARRKDLGREALARAGLPVPAFRRLRLDRDLHAQLRGLRYPCVVKPLGLSASRGVIRADDAAGVCAACARIERILGAEVRDPELRSQLLVEDFLPGAEVAVEGMLEGGELHPLALFDKPEPLDGPYFEETYYVTPSRLPAPWQARVLQRVREACAAYGLSEGPVHAELRVHGGEAWVLEVAARTIGGECSRLLRFGTGRTLEELVIEHALGRPLSVDSEAGAAGVLMIPVPAAGTLRRVEGVLAARRVPGVTEVVISVREGYELVPLPEGSRYPGFIFARAPDPAQVEEALREAHRRLRFVVAPAWRIEPA